MLQVAGISGGIGCKEFQIEISASGYWARGDYDLTERRVGPHTMSRRISPFNCVGDTFSNINYQVTGSPRTIEVPCTLVAEKVRIVCRDQRVVFDGPVTSECDGSGLCVFR